MNHKNFDLGNIYITPGASKAVSTVDVIDALKRHVEGDYGEISELDKEINKEALETGGRVMSAYISGDIRFWIITEADRAATTILLPSEY